MIDIGICLSCKMKAEEWHSGQVFFCGCKNIHCSDVPSTGTSKEEARINWLNLQKRCRI